MLCYNVPKCPKTKVEEGFKNGWFFLTCCCQRQSCKQQIQTTRKALACKYYIETPSEAHYISFKDRDIINMNPPSYILNSRMFLLDSINLVGPNHFRINFCFSITLRTKPFSDLHK